MPYFSKQKTHWLKSWLQKRDSFSFTSWKLLVFSEYSLWKLISLWFFTGNLLVLLNEIKNKTKTKWNQVPDTWNSYTGSHEKRSVSHVEAELRDTGRRHEQTAHSHGEMAHSSFFFFALLPDLWDLSSPTRHWTQALSSESSESKPLDCQGAPVK